MQSLCLKGPWPHKRFASSSQLLHFGFKGQPCLRFKDVQSVGFLCMMVKSRGDVDASAGSQLYCKQPADDLLVVYKRYARFVLPVVVLLLEGSSPAS